MLWKIERFRPTQHNLTLQIDFTGQIKLLSFSPDLISIATPTVLHPKWLGVTGEFWPDLEKLLPLEVSPPWPQTESPLPTEPPISDLRNKFSFISGDERIRIRILEWERWKPHLCKCPTSIINHLQIFQLLYLDFLSFPQLDVEYGLKTGWLASLSTSSRSSRLEGSWLTKAVSIRRLLLRLHCIVSLEMAMKLSKKDPTSFPSASNLGPRALELSVTFAFNG